MTEVHHDLALILDVVDSLLKRRQLGVGEVEGDADDRLPVGAGVGETKFREWFHSLCASVLTCWRKFTHWMRNSATCTKSSARRQSNRKSTIMVPKKTTYSEMAIQNDVLSFFHRPRMYSLISFVCTSEVTVG